LADRHPPARRANLRHHELFGQYLTCPWPNFSGAQLTLSASHAAIHSHGDSGPNSADLEGFYAVSGDQLELTFTSGSSESGGVESKVSEQEPVRLRLRIRHADGPPLLGPGVEEKHARTALLFLVRAASRGGELPRAIDCPAVVQGWQADALRESGQR
jgi:hypothetical protein